MGWVARTGKKALAQVGNQQGDPAEDRDKQSDEEQPQHNPARLSLQKNRQQDQYYDDTRSSQRKPNSFGQITSFIQVGFFG